MWDTVVCQDLPDKNLACWLFGSGAPRIFPIGAAEPHSLARRSPPSNCLALASAARSREEQASRLDAEKVCSQEILMLEASMTPWDFKGKSLVNCTYGCNCQLSTAVGFQASVAA